MAEIATVAASTKDRNPRRSPSVFSRFRAGASAASGKPVAPECAERWGVLMAAAQNGDSAAYEEVLREIADWVRTLGTDPHPEAIDEQAVCAVLMRVHKARFTYDPRRPFGPWISAVVGYSLRISATAVATGARTRG